MKMFSDCRGPCNTCEIHYTCTCLAGHGDDDYVHVSPEWIKTWHWLQGLTTQQLRALACQQKIVSWKTLPRETLLAELSRHDGVLGA